MKKKAFFTTMFIFMMLAIVQAQPNPPLGPYGNPVPVGYYSIVLLLMACIIVKTKKHEK